DRRYRIHGWLPSYGVKLFRARAQVHLDRVDKLNRCRITVDINSGTGRGSARPGAAPNAHGTTVCLEVGKQILRESLRRNHVLNLSEVLRVRLTSGPGIPVVAGYFLHHTAPQARAGEIIYVRSNVRIQHAIHIAVSINIAFKAK